jgi:uncharacterized protein YjbI with pentapeptide repeats
LANSEHLAKIEGGVPHWNGWRKQNREVQPDLNEAYLRRADLTGANLTGATLIGATLGEAHLRGADLTGADLARANLSDADLREANLTGANLTGAHLTRAHLGGANLREADLREADLREAYLCDADLTGADLRGADLTGADLARANLTGADLRETHLRGATHLGDADLTRADLRGTNLTGVDLRGAHLSDADLRAAHLIAANLTGADLRGANLTGVDLRGATLVNTNLEATNLTACSVFGISAWNVRLEKAVQSNLVITPEGEAPIQVDNLEVAQFIYLLLNNQKIRRVIDTITSKVVLILGRFTPDRKIVLDAIRDDLRKRDYLPILFDFEKPTSRSLTDTISTLAHMARFVIADITDARSIPQELMRIVPFLPTVPVQPLILATQHEYGMFRDFALYPWVLEPFLYKDQSALLAELDEKVIAPAEAKARKQVRKQK